MEKSYQENEDFYPLYKNNVNNNSLSYNKNNISRLNS